MIKPWMLVDTSTGEVVYRFATSKEARKWAAAHNADHFESAGSRPYEVRKFVVTDPVRVAKLEQQLNAMFEA